MCFAPRAPATISPTPTTCIVAIQLSTSVVKAFDVQISDKGDVYVNYKMSGLPEAHASYHASGQQHIKKARKFVQWNGGATGKMEPIKLFRTPPSQVITRSDCGSTIGWYVEKLPVLPVLAQVPDMLVGVRGVKNSSIVAFEVNVIGAWARKLRSNRAVEVEVIAFDIPEGGSPAWTEDF